MTTRAPDPADWARHRFGLSEAAWASLAGRVALVTGAGTGIGRATATALAAAGSTVWLAGRRADRLDAARDALPALGIDPARARPLPLDLRDADAVPRAIATITAAQGPVGVLVHAAAIPPPPAGPWPLAHADEAQWANQIATNLTAPWRLARALLDETRAPALRLLFLSSLAGWTFTPGFGPYNVAKAALNSLTASLAAECAARFPGADIQINAVEPGVVQSEMNPVATDSPYAVVPVLLRLIAQPAGGPTGRFFRRDGTGLPFGAAAPWDGPLA